MPAQQSAIVGISEKIGLLVPYVKKRLIAQISAVALIVCYLILFQVIILSMPIRQASVVALGIGVVIGGLAFFMEGLFLGLMPLGETIGIMLPQKSKLPGILLFAGILGFGVTLAEPAIGVLQSAGSSVKAWDAPLLFLFLNKNSLFLVYTVGAGVGIAVILGMLRFIYNWSLKPYLYILISLSTVITIAASLHPNMKFLVGLAWDCGGVTTGPVTVPLVLALGIGICRVVSKSTSQASGFGVVTLASILPIITVLGLGALFMGQVPNPAPQESFFNPQTLAKVESLFRSHEDMLGYALKNATPQAQLAAFGNDRAAMLDHIQRMTSDAPLREKTFGRSDLEVLNIWAVQKGTDEQRLVVFGSPEAVTKGVQKYSAVQLALFDPVDVLKRNAVASVRAIVPLTLFLLIVLFLILRERLTRPDEVVLGILFGIIGMLLFNIGIELGLQRLGNGVGSTLPALFKKIELTDSRKVINGFDTAAVQTALKPEGGQERFFMVKEEEDYIQIPFDAASYDTLNKSYIFTPSRGPLYGSRNILLGLIVVFLFAFVMGYGATLAEPALNALGITVEELTVGTFKKFYLMQAVACGVGLGMVLGLVKIIYNVPLVCFLAPLYALLLLLSKISSEEYVNIGWDSAGVTTGPITVPLVLAMGLGISGQVNAVEGFGILAMASVMPIIMVLSMGLIVNWRRKAAEKAS